MVGGVICVCVCVCFSTQQKHHCNAFRVWLFCSAEFGYFALNLSTPLELCPLIPLGPWTDSGPSGFRLLPSPTHANNVYQGSQGPFRFFLSPWKLIFPLKKRPFKSFDSLNPWVLSVCQEYFANGWFHFCCSALNRDVTA